MKKSFGRKIIVGALLLAALELAARIYLFIDIPEGMKPRSFGQALRMFVSGGSYVGEFRGRRYLFDKPEGVFRILAVGGSTTMGVRGDDETWPAKLEARLNRAAPGGRRYEVVNVAQCGAASAQEYFYLRTHAYLDPDLVIVYDGYNDLLFSNAHSAHYLLASARTYGLLARPFGAAKVKDFLYRNSALVNRVDVYLYRLQNALNRLIFEKRWFGLGSQNRLRTFENVEWYASHFALEPEVERTRRVDAATLGKGKPLTVSERALAERILSAAKDGGLATDEFIAAVAASKASDADRRGVLKAIGLDRLDFKVGGLTVRHDVLDLTGRRPEIDLFPEIYRYNLDNIGAFLALRRTPAVFVYQPFLSEKIMRLRGALDAAALAGFSNFRVEEDRHFVAKSPARKAIMREAAARHGLVFLDAQDTFDGERDGEVYLDNCHNTDLGLDILAARFETFLKERRLVPA